MYHWGESFHQANVFLKVIISVANYPKDLLLAHTAEGKNPSLNIFPI
jgi:hypothetical protein